MCVVEKADEQTWPQNGPATHLPFPPISRWPAGDRRQVTGQTERKRGGERAERGAAVLRNCTLAVVADGFASTNVHRKRQVISCLCQVIWRGCRGLPPGHPPLPKEKAVACFSFLTADRHTAPGGQGRPPACRDLLWFSRLQSAIKLLVGLRADLSHTLCDCHAPVPAWPLSACGPAP